MQPIGLCTDGVGTKKLQKTEQLIWSLLENDKFCITKIDILQILSHIKFILSVFSHLPRLYQNRLWTFD